MFLDFYANIILYNVTYIFHKFSCTTINPYCISK